ncbi:Sphingosine-1-phosphate phosphatase 2-like [Oopsacas minuta]|uniref:Sphingosine-1-phosphate phosphatase 2-like n=1 Tax=Oopsacas minuta TaxID=111878 RepID=A0AAV7JK16_9METZ|nr:Sphingosine-1-phosphate phosphatase 2-like [Oopsacas minuta]
MYSKVMLDTFVTSLKDPNWVARVQSWLGVSYAESETNTNTLLSNQIAEFIGDTQDTDSPPPPEPYHRSPSEERLHELGQIDISRRKEQLSQTRRPVRTNPILHVYFSLATELGYEPFYITFIPFIFWSYDPYIGYRITANWVVSMYVGQALKNYWRIPRPACPPAIPLELETATEYGAPSTHAIVGTGLPFYTLYLVYNNYEISFLPSLSLAVLWCVSICLSRVYLGVHSLWDIVTGILISVSILLLVEPVLNICDPVLFERPGFVFVLPLLQILLIKIYPKVEWWSMDLGDTTAILGSGSSMIMGCFLNTSYYTFFLGHLVTKGCLGFAVGTITIEKIGLSVLRSVIGILILIPVRFSSKFLFYRIIPPLFGNHLPLDQVTKIPHYELPYKYLTYNLIGLCITLFVPKAFILLGIPNISL